MASAILEIRTKQQLALTPRLQQSVKLLQLSAIEFEQEIEQALANNPFLEEADQLLESEGNTSPRESLESGNEYLVNDFNTVLAVCDPLTEGEESLSINAEMIDHSADISTKSDFDLSQVVEDFSGDYSTFTGSRSEEGEGGILEQMQSQPTLREHLYTELGMLVLGERDRALCELIIDSLDDDGYLRQNLEDFLSEIEAEPPLCLSELIVALTRVQQLDPAGIGARSLSECLGLQLQAGLNTSRLNEELAVDYRVALDLVTGHLDQLARRDLLGLQQALHCNHDTVHRAYALIRRLNPRPGLRFNRTNDNYIVPDVIVRKIKNHWNVMINPAVLPKARLHHVYADMFVQSGNSSRSPLAQQLQEARWLLRNAEQRFSTIQRVAEAIVTHQKHFFNYGDVALKPLVLRDVAEELNLHESTISRATSNKYMVTPRGIFEFKYFFSRKLATDTGGSCSTMSVRALIKEMIEFENAEAPLSDVILTKMLAEQGVIVARRTVAKYRGLMKIPSVEFRRAG